MMSMMMSMTIEMMAFEQDALFKTNENYELTAICMYYSSTINVTERADWRRTVGSEQLVERDARLGRRVVGDV
jgi:hypothetical protein